MNKQQMIDEIYEEMADKTLSFGCKVHIGNLLYLGIGDTHYEDVILKTSKKDGYDVYLCSKLNIRHYSNIEGAGRKNNGIVKSIGHPVLLGVVVSYLKKKINGYVLELILLDLLKRRGDGSKPIEDKSEKCIGQVHNLIERVHSIIEQTKSQE